MMIEKKTVLTLIPFLQSIDFPHKLGICEKLFGKAIASSGICWVKTCTGLAWKLDLNDPTHSLSTI